VLALLFASPSTALRPTTIALDQCVGHEATASAFQIFAEKTWRLPRWERRRPRPAVIRAFHLKLRCAAGPGHRDAIKRRWRESKVAFYEHRERKLAQRERLRYLPFTCGGGTRSAIPCSIMWCESGGSYTARNGVSTAGGKYQVIDGTWWSYGGRHYADSHPAAVAPPVEQDRVAAAIYADVGSSAWACA
jgi:hypothetical protein